jgi:hypothetical protein
MDLPFKRMDMNLAYPGVLAGPLYGGPQHVCSRVCFKPSDLPPVCMQSASLHQLSIIRSHSPTDCMPDVGSNSALVTGLVHCRLTERKHTNQLERTAHGGASYIRHYVRGRCAIQLACMRLPVISSGDDDTPSLAG